MKKQVICIMLLLCMAVTGYAAGMNDVIDDYYEIPSEREAAFLDVPDTLPSKEAIDYLYKYRIIDGMSAEYFMPLNNVTREQFVKILINAFGLYDETAESGFDDSSARDWHYPYISSAKEIGMVMGIDEHTFGVGLPIQRQEMVAMAYRMANYISMEFTGGQQVDFADMDSVSKYAQEAVSKLAAEGFLQPDADGNFRPDVYATREDACMLIYQMIKNT